MPPGNRRLPKSRSSVGLALFFGWVLVGCRSPEPVLFDNEGVAYRERAPAPFRLAVAPFELPPSLEAGLAVTGVRRTAPELQTDLVRAFEEQRVSSDVFATASGDSFNAYREQADLMLRPRLEDARFRRDGATGRAFLSTALWLTTWIGGLWVEDSRYDANIRMTYDLVDPNTGVLVATNKALESTAVDLTFWERNEAFSSGFFASMFIPPFLAHDDRTTTENSLVRRANRVLAAQVKAYLIEELPAEESQLLATLTIEAPLNGEESTGLVDFRCRIGSLSDVTEALLLVNGEVHSRWDEEELSSLAGQAAGEEGRMALTISAGAIPLSRPGKNLLRVMANVAGQWASRSIVVYNAAPNSTPVRAD